MFVCLRAVAHMLVRAFLLFFEKIFTRSLLFFLVLFACVCIKLEQNWFCCYFVAFVAAKKKHMLMLSHVTVACFFCLLALLSLRLYV